MEQVKAVIQAANPDFEASLQKVIHAGKVLKNEQVISESGVKEKDFLVVMMAKVAASCASCCA